MNLFAVLVPAPKIGFAYFSTVSKEASYWLSSFKKDPMATRKQIAANRRNALKSTGPHTERGKSFTRLNALRHGLRAQPGTLSAESLHELSQIRAQFVQSFQPENSEQLRRVQRMACARWQLLDCQRAETRFLSEPSQADPLIQLHVTDAFSRRQARYQRAFTDALEQYRRFTRPDPTPELPPAA